MNLIQRLFQRRPERPGDGDDDVVTAARRRLEDDRKRREQVEEDLRILARRPTSDG